MQYEDGKVCLSLLGTWSGPAWEPDTSTLLQLLVSVQGLILIEHPYCNEPGQHRDGGSEASTYYNRTVQAGVLDNMLRMAKDPPDGTQALVRSFLTREGPGLLFRARTYPNDLVKEEDIIKLDTLLGHPTGKPVQEKAPAMPEDQLPSWILVAEESFVSGYGEREPGYDDYDDY